ncbi:hypothetical protein [Desertibaculum subflavum]|uniref:hypothetical protein n=1 Tax=Desertibaculum subflavum TaxID=2268458 RepID=UPI000E66DED5
MDYVCDASKGRTWFRIATAAEAAAESALMDHAVDKHFLREESRARQSYVPTSPVYIEQEIGLKKHIRRAMPLFLTLRDGQGNGLATAMLPPEGKEESGFRIIIVGPGNRDPYPDHREAIEALGRHYGLSLERERCYPYGGGRGDY